jgi:hypothetical protein
LERGFCAEDQCAFDVRIGAKSTGFRQIVRRRTWEGLCDEVRDDRRQPNGWGIADVFKINVDTYRLTRECESGAVHSLQNNPRPLGCLVRLSSESESLAGQPQGGSGRRVAYLGASGGKVIRLPRLYQLIAGNRSVGYDRNQRKGRDDDAPPVWIAIPLLLGGGCGLFYGLAVFKFGAKSVCHFFTALFILLISMMVTGYAASLVIAWSIP